MIFLDTSAIFALADAADKDHALAKTLFGQAMKQGEDFFLHNYIIIESIALIQRRLGLPQAKKVLEETAKFYTVWVGNSLHRQAMEYFRNRATKDLSFVDCVSFIVMRHQGATTVFAFDDDFNKHGFTLYQCLLS